MMSEMQNINTLGVKVADHITAMIAYWDKDLVCRFANSAYVDWFDRKKEEMINKITLKELLGPLYEKNQPYITGALKGEIQTFEREIPLPLGGTRHSLANYYPDIVDGEVKGFFVHVADVTPLKLLEQELLASNKTINEQNKSLLNFSNIVSHDLTSYSTNLASILELFCMADSEEEKYKMLDFLKRISDGFSSTVNNLNEIVRSQNFSSIKPEIINLYDYIEKSKDILLIEIESSHAIINNNVDKEIEILANPAYIESIILNLLSNSIKYRQAEKASFIELSSRKENDKTILKIKDNGKGINLEKHGRDLFGLYKTFHGNSDAHGIGLYITKYQIDTIGGQIKVESKENVGTTFYIYFNSCLS